MTPEEQARAQRIVKRAYELRHEATAKMLECGEALVNAYTQLAQMYADIDFDIAREIAENPYLAEWNVAMDSWYPAETWP